MSVPVKIYRSVTYQEGQTPSNPNLSGDPIVNPINPDGGPAEELVPYLGALRDVNLGEFGLSTGYITFDTTPTNTPTTQGTMFWDDDDLTVDVILNGYQMKIGEDVFYPVKNQTGSNIAKGVAVRFAGTVGASGRLLIEPFTANGTYASSRFMGVTAEAIDNGEDGKVLWFGRIRGINTNAFNEGDILYASTTTAGGYQTTVPVAPNNIIEVAAVVTKSINQGVIFVRPTFGSNINRDEGVKIVSPTNGQALVYNSTSQLWENGTVIPSETIQTVSTNGTINNLSTTGTTVIFTGTTVILTGLVALTNGTEISLVNFTGSNLSISGESVSSSANNRFKSGFTILNGQTVRFKYLTNDNRWFIVSGFFNGILENVPFGIANGLRTDTKIGIGRSPVLNATLSSRASTSDNTQSALYLDNSSETRLLSVAGDGLVDIAGQLLVGGGTSVPLTTYSLWVRTKGNTSSEGSIYLLNTTGSLLTIWDGVGDQRSVGGATFGVQRIPTGRVEIRGKGISTVSTLSLEDSAGNVTFSFLDNGNLSIPSTNGAKIGTATSQKIGFWNATPIVQPTTAVASATRVGGGGTTLTDTDTFDGYTLAQIVKALRNAGLLA